MKFKNPFVPLLPPKPTTPAPQPLVKPQVEPKPIIQQMTPQAQGTQNINQVTPSLSVSGLVWNTNIPQAIVNGNIVKIGDTLEGVKIVNIKRTGIEISYQGKQSLISMDNTPSSTGKTAWSTMP